jgi:hypothetical protein
MFKEKPLKKQHSDARLTIDVLHKNMIESMSEDEENEYFLKNGLLLDKYYSNEEVSSVTTTKQNSILNFFTNKSASLSKDKPPQETVMDKYMNNIHDEKKDCKSILSSHNNCRLCNHEMKFKIVENELFCTQCGFTEEIIVHSEKVSFKDVPREVSYFAYKRINHFNEWLAQFQAKETTDIPDKVYIDVLSEIKKNKNIDINEITYKQIREILKRVKHNKYYEHIHHIMNVISNKQAPLLNHADEEKLRNMFKEIQVPFMNNCPQERKNFLSYSYVLHKFCELLELDHLLIHFPLLKSREKLQQQDTIWKLICQDLKWQYIPSV